MADQADESMLGMIEMRTPETGTRLLASRRGAQATRRGLGMFLSDFATDQLGANDPMPPILHTNWMSPGIAT